MRIAFYSRLSTLGIDSLPKYDLCEAVQPSSTGTLQVPPIKETRGKYIPRTDLYQNNVAVEYQT
ncbi:hypothetical protein M422DRAFT_34643 [Sphaerobolus stellatus SS14]|uniref:Uncharacterized protein n=1 Tax=Sphaerobolus stellatus (strain SS14) TaxID=990650 RepID=A0A0C9VDM8_SPHS4|nr:hypothetical protein M422DRAFT_34643 [Sphaerobolus stellatus SS14]